MARRRITLQVVAVPAGAGRRAARSQEYERPAAARTGRSWTALNHIKDRARRHAVVPLVVPDGHLRQLRHDGQRRAEADLRHVPHRLRARARCASSRSRNFPVIRDLVVDIDDFMQKLPRVKPWIIREEREAGRPTGEYLQTPEELDAYKQFSMCINCMLCYAACPVYGLDPDFIGPAAIALAAALQPRLAATRARASGSTCSSEHEGVWGCTFVGECTRVCPKHVDPAGAIQRYKLKAALRLGEGVPAAAGRAMTRAAVRTPTVSSALAPPAGLHLVVAAEAVLLRVRDARAEQHLRRLVRGVPAAARLRGRAGARRPTSASWTGPRTPLVVALNVVSLALRGAARGDLVQPDAEGDGRAASAASGCRDR